MARIDVLRERWKPILRYEPEFRAAQTRVLAEEGVWVELNRLYAHTQIESGGKKDAKSGPNDCCGGRCSSDCGDCCEPGENCGPDCRAWGLMQIFWPPFGGIDWNKITDAGYNAYIGCKVLARRYKQCGNWRGASIAFFSSSCTDVGTIDPNTGTDVAEYDAAMTNNLAELQELGVGTSEDPKGRPPNGSPNTKEDKPKAGCTIWPIVGEICVPQIELSPVSILTAMFEQYFPRIAFIALGIVLLGIGVAAVVFDTGPLGRILG